jgi:lambda family phage portal protein
MPAPKPTGIPGMLSDLRADYSAARGSQYRRPRRGLPAMGSHADYHLRNEFDYYRMMEMARDYDRNDVIVSQMVDRAVLNTVRGGFALDCTTGDPGLDEAIEARWAEWSGDPEQCDVAGEHTWNDMVALAFRQELVDGDHFLLGVNGGALQSIEAHRVKTPSNTKRDVVLGVKLDEFRRRLEYWVTKEDVAPASTVQRVSDIMQYPARDADGLLQVFHLYDPSRTSQTRGVTSFAPIFDSLSMFEDINWATLVKQQAAAAIFLIHSRAQSLDGISSYASPTGETRENRIIDKLAPGMEIFGEPGETIQGFAPNIPSPAFLEHMKMTLTLIGINLGMPLVMLLMDAKETNFSGFRGAMDQARDGFRRNQERLIRRIYNPVYAWKMSQWMLEDPAIARVVAGNSAIKLMGHNWNPPQWPYIDPYKDAQADAMRMDKNLTSPRRLHAERGRNYYEVIGELVEDRAALIRRAAAEAKKINAEFPEAGVVWQDLAGGLTEGGQSELIRAVVGAQASNPMDENEGSRDE